MQCWNGWGLAKVRAPNPLCADAETPELLWGSFCPSQGGDKAAADERIATRPRFCVGIIHFETYQLRRRWPTLAGAVRGSAGRQAAQCPEREVASACPTRSWFRVRFTGPAAVVLLKLADLSILSCTWVYLGVIARRGAKSEKNECYLG